MYYIVIYNQCLQCLHCRIYLGHVSILVCCMETLIVEILGLARKVLTGTDERDSLEVLCILYDLRARLSKY